MVKKVFSSILVGACVCGVSAQQAYFADGYHGGIYGHYPKNYTRFIVDKMDEFPLWRINMEIEPETWDSVKVNDRIGYDRFRDMASGPRVEFTNPTYAQPYLYNISGESIIRQFEYGMKKLRAHFPDVAFTTYSVEEPCFTSSLPQILKLFGFKYAVLKNPDTMWGGYMAPYGGELVNWVGPDGTSMLTVPRYACEALAPNSTWQTTAWNNSREYLDSCFKYGIGNPVGMCYQDAGWDNGPWLGGGSNSRNRYVTWTEYFESISLGQSNDRYRMSQNDVRVALMWGSQVLQRVAQEVRQAENELVVAEKISAMAAIESGYRFPSAAFDKAWRTLMLAQHHDAWIVPYNNLSERGTWADYVKGWTDSTDVIVWKSLSSALRTFDAPRDKSVGPTVVRLFNPTGTERLEPVKIAVPGNLAGKRLVVVDAEGREVPSVQYKNNSREVISFRASVPSFGYSSYALKAKYKVSESGSGVEFMENGDCKLENDMYRIVIDSEHGGTIKSLVAKKEDGKEFVDAAGKFRMGELRGYFYRDSAFYSSAESPVRINVVEDTPFETSVRIDGAIGKHVFSQIVSIAKGKRGIDFELRVDWNGKPGIGEYDERDWGNRRRAFYDTRYMFNVMFPNSLTDTHLSKDAPFDVCESGTGDTFFNRWDSIKNNVILHWVDLMQDDGNYGMALFTDHTTSYSYGAGFPLSLTAQYAGGGLWGRNYAIEGPLHLKYAIMPHKGAWDIAQIAEESALRNEGVKVTIGTGIPLADRSFIEFDKPGYEITAVKASPGKVMVRLFNVSGDDDIRTIRLSFPIEKAVRVDLNGKVLSEAVFTPMGTGAMVVTAMPRFGVETLVFSLKK